MEESKAIVVTGVSTGIGYGLLGVLTGAGYHVYGSVRKQADADRLQKEFGAAFTPLLLDVTNEAAVKAAAAQVPIIAIPGVQSYHLQAVDVDRVIYQISTLLCSRHKSLIPDPKSWCICGCRSKSHLAFTPRTDRPVFNFH